RTVDDDPGAPFFNDTTKYVVSATLTAATWRNSKVIGPYDPDAIRRLKEEVDGDLYVSGSGTLVRAMLADGLVDELHLFVYPLTRPAATCCACGPPWEALLLEEDECDFSPPCFEALGELAIFAARSFDIPFSLRASYCFSFLTWALFPGICPAPF